MQRTSVQPFTDSSTIRLEGSPVIFGQRIDVSGVEVNVESRASDGRSVLFVHGLGGSVSNFSALARAFAEAEEGGDVETGRPHQAENLSALDLPGYGGSAPAIHGQHTVSAHTAALIALLETRDEPIHLVGNSMGGLVSVLAACHRPDLVASLALVSPALPTWQLEKVARRLTLLAVPRVGETVLTNAAARVPIDKQVSVLIGDLFGEPARVDPAYVQAARTEREARLAQDYANAVLLESLRSMVRMFLPPRRLWSLIADNHTPTLVMYGGRDKLVHAAWSRWQHNRPDAQVVSFPTMGHVAMLERADLVAPVIREFWSGLK